MKAVKCIALLLVVIGAINWGLVGAFEFNLVEFLFDRFGHMVCRVIYAVVGLAGLYLAAKYCFCCKSCGTGCSTEKHKRK